MASHDRCGTLRGADHGDWLPLWNSYNAFYRHETTRELADSTFARHCEQSQGLFALVAMDEGDRLVTRCCTPSTWTTAPYCYLEDLFVAEQCRGTGAARALIDAVYHEADARGAARVYWHTREFNAPARSLYDQVAHRTSFVVYRRARTRATRSVDHLTSTALEDASSTYDR